MAGNILAKLKQTSPKRKVFHLQDYDYSRSGLYFVTIVTNNRVCRFGTVKLGGMELNDAGEMVLQVCLEIQKVIPELRFEPFQIMPNHIHSIIDINNGVGSGLCARPGESHLRQNDKNQPLIAKNPISIFDVVGRFKSLTTRIYKDGVINHGCEKFEQRLWQRSFYEHVIRNEQNHQDIVDYILMNPANWEEDEDHVL